MSTGAPAADVPAASRWRARVTHGRPEVDVAGAEQAAAALLAALGIDLHEEHLARTPHRMAQALIEMTSGADFELTTFANDDAYDELVVVRDIAFQSVCEHHVLPFVGVAHVGYVPGARMVGLSKLARTVELHARRPQTQERLTQHVADFLGTTLAPEGVGVVMHATHTCMSLRGARTPGATTTTSALVGRLRDDPRTRAEFLALTRSVR